LIDTAAIELNVLFPLLLRECGEMLDGCAVAVRLLQPTVDDPAITAAPIAPLRARLACGCDDVKSLLELHQDVLEMCGQVIVVLQRAVSARAPAEAAMSDSLDRLYQHLGQAAANRHAWQAVFSSPSALGS
jgi:hypothetical protein